MKIIYNPDDGAPITNFAHRGVQLDPLEIGGLVQYEDYLAEALLENFGFLQEVTPEQAKNIKAKPVNEDLPCDYCDKTFPTKRSLQGHTLGAHKAELTKAKTPVVDIDVVPVGGTKKIIGKNEIDKMTRKYERTGEMPTGSDADGVEWYGAGVTEENSSLSKAKKIGEEGHFGG